MLELIILNELLFPQGNRFLAKVIDVTEKLF